MSETNFDKSDEPVEERISDEYSDPLEFEVSRIGTLAIAFAIIVLLGPPAIFLTVKTSFPVIIKVTKILEYDLGLEAQIAFILAFVAVVHLLIGIAIIIIIIHEVLHFQVEKTLGLEPEFIYDEYLFFKNPAVMTFKTYKNPNKGIPATLAPVVSIGLISGIAILVTAGFVKGVFAWILLSNTGSSASDLCLAFTLWRMPKDTVIRNYRDENGDPRTEVIYPSE